MKLTDAWAFLLPEGWARFVVGDGREHELNVAIEQVVALALPDTLPRDSAEPIRRMMRDRLRAAIGDAQGAGASVVYMPIRPVDGVFIPAAIVEVEFDGDAGSDALSVVESVLADGYDESEVINIDGRPAVRVTSSLHEVERDGDWPIVSSRQVIYAINRDEVEGLWIALSFSVVWNSHDSARLAEALMLFFDAVMTTFRWAGGADDLGSEEDAAAVSGSARRSSSTS